MAARLLLSGDLLSGTDAAAAGLVAASLPDGEAAMTEALALARRVATQSPLAVRATLRGVCEATSAELASRVANAHELLCTFTCEPTGSGGGGSSLAVQQWSVSLDSAGRVSGVRVEVPFLAHGRAHPSPDEDEPAADLRSASSVSLLARANSAASPVG